MKRKTSPFFVFLLLGREGRKLGWPADETLSVTFRLFALCRFATLWVVFMAHFRNFIKGDDGQNVLKLGKVLLIGRGFLKQFSIIIMLLSASARQWDDIL